MRRKFQTGGGENGAGGFAANEAPHQPRAKGQLGRLGRRIFAFALPHRRLLIIGLAALAVASGINLYFPVLIRGFLNNKFGLHIDSDLSLIASLLIGLFLIQAAAFYVRHYSFAIAGYRVVAEIRSELYRSIVEQDVEFFDRARVGDLLSRLSSDTEIVQRAVTNNISIALRYTVQVIGGTVLMLLLSPRLTFLILATVPILAVASSIGGKKLRTISRKIQAVLGTATAAAEESFTFIRSVKVFAGPNYEAARYQEFLDTSVELGRDRTKIAALFSSGMVFLLHSTIVVVFWVGASLVFSNSLTFGDLVSFLLYCVIVAVSFSFLVSAWDEFMQAIGAAERIFEIIDRPRQIVSPQDAVSPAQAAEGSIDFNEVSFFYPSRPEVLVLNRVSFRIAAGSTVALVGPSGSGKSTIASLLPRYYDPVEGTVSYGGVQLPQIDLDEFRSLISVVSQSPQIFSVSIRDNIRYGRLDASDEQIEQAVRDSNLQSFIDKLPEGLETLVGDKGIQLSGGEKQRLAIARALIKDPKILILDEATSSLDSENEHLVQQALESLMKNRTTLIIAHRLSTIQHADLVLVMNNGQIVQRGTHQSLMAEAGLYKTLVEYQLL